jgi:hypothetical protein
MKTNLGTTPAIRERRQRVMQLYPTLSYSGMASVLGVPRSTIESDCAALFSRGVDGMRWRNGGLKWDDAHTEILTLMRPVMSLVDIAALLGRTEKSVDAKVSDMGLKRQKPVSPSKPSKAQKAQKAQKAPKEQKPKTAASLSPLPKYKGPPPMTTAQRTAHEKTRITYPHGRLPWRAHGMFGPALVGYDLSYRGQKPAAAQRN